MLYSLGVFAYACLTFASPVIGPHGGIHMDLRSVAGTTMSEINFAKVYEFFSCFSFRPLSTGAVVNKVHSSSSSLSSDPALLVCLSDRFYAFTYAEINGDSSTLQTPVCGSEALGILRRMSPKLALISELDDVSADVHTAADGAVLSVSKARCVRCAFLSRVEGHRDRCLTSTQQRSAHVLADEARRLAWLGDALHHLDIRRALLAGSVPSAELDTLAQGYAVASAQAGWYSRNAHLFPSGSVHASLGRSERQLSTAFEASYVGEFRKKYCNEVLSIQPLLNLDNAFSLDSI